LKYGTTDPGFRGGDPGMNGETSKGRIRFAPNVSGSLHLGNARTALVAWMVARARGLEFHLRLDDDPVHRVYPDPPGVQGEEWAKGEKENAIDRELRWLGLDWDNAYRLSERTGLALWFMDGYAAESNGCRTFRFLKDYLLLMPRGVSCFPQVLVSFVDDLLSGTSVHVRGTDLKALEEPETALWSLLAGGGACGAYQARSTPPAYLYAPVLGSRVNVWHKTNGAGVTLRECMDRGMDPGKVRTYLVHSLTSSKDPVDAVPVTLAGLVDLARMSRFQSSFLSGSVLNTEFDRQEFDEAVK